MRNIAQKSHAKTSSIMRNLRQKRHKGNIMRHTHRFLYLIIAICGAFFFIGAGCGIRIISQEVPPLPDAANTQEVPPLPDAATTESVDSCQEQIETFKQKDPPKYDFLFVVDHSKEMEKYSIADNEFGKIARYYTDLKIDAQAIVISTDTSGQYYQAGCTRGSRRTIYKPNQDFIGLHKELAAMPVTEAKPQGLEAVYQALLPAQRGKESCSKGFLRKDATLVIIVVSSSLDHSPQTVETYKAALDALKDNPREQIRIITLTGPSPGGCTLSNRQVPAAPRYHKWADRPLSYQGSFCDLPWMQQISSVFASSGPASLFYVTLSRPPLPETIKVKVNGKEIPQSDTDGWSYDAKNNQVVFSHSQTPPASSSITVTYTPQCSP
ncbi:MAG TPA: hypothetical protein DCE42_02225 [Myxococcales bacterium]|nr:hypothetical protein [Deltaproteobacteria bacterium]HAA53541.1 hypothetical protein [Myxococcales bacterium]